MIERFDDGRADIPVDRRGAGDDAVAVARGNRDHRGGLDPEAAEVGADLGVDVAEPAVVIADAVHLVDDDHDLAHAEQMQEIAVPPGLFAHPLGGIDDQHRRIGLGGAGDHVAQELGVARRIDQDEIARRRAEADLAGVDGDPLVAFGLQRIEQERQLERHAAPRADRLELLELAVRQAAGLRQQASDQGVRRDKAALSSGCRTHPATAPAGSNRSSYGGDEIAEAFGMRVTNWWQRECAGRNASERRASLEKDDAQADPTTLSGKADTAGLPSETIRPTAAPG